MAQNAKYIDLEATFTDSTLPDAGDLPFLTNGSYCFIEPGHPWAPQHIGNKQSVTVPNLAFGMTTGWATTAPSASSTNTGMALASQGSTPGFVGSEMTAKGALHGIAAAGNFNAHGYMGVPASVLQSILHSNSGQKYYVALSHRVTRAPSGTGRDSWSGITNSDSSWLWNFDSNGDKPADGNSARLGHNRQGADDASTGLVFRSIGVNGFTGTWPSAGPDGMALWKVGSNANWEVSSAAKVKGSHILYFFYLENLTVSGRSYADVDALVYAYHQRIHGANGRYNGDSWTSPADFSL